MTERSDGTRRAAPAGLLAGILVVVASFGGCGRSSQNPGVEAGGATGVATSGGAPNAGGTAQPIAGAATQTGEAGGAALGGAGGEAGEGSCGSPTDPRNCGRCGRDCTALPFVNPEGIGCVDGQCSYDEDACLPGFGHCSDREGCADDLTTAEHCGTCARKCGGSGPYCASPRGQVASCVETCPPELTRCGNQCVDLASNRGHCGQCSLACNLDFAWAKCSDAECIVSSCSVGHADCSPEAPGCETFLGTFDNCAGCGDSCGAAAHAIGVCEARQCTHECEAGFGDCDATAPDCETSLDTAQNCGACGHECQAERPLCQEGVCVATCASNLSDECRGGCVDLETNANHCGSCAVSCAAYQTCELGACTPRYVSTSFIEGEGVTPRAVDGAADGTLALGFHFEGTADFDPGPGSDERTSRGWVDAVIAKLGPNSTYAWSRSIGGPGLDSPVGVALTPSGAVVTALQFNESVDLDPTEGVDAHGATGASSTAALVKLEADGSFAWARSFPATHDEPNFAGSWPGALITDRTGAMYMTGTFQGALQLEPGQPAVATSQDQTSFLLKLTEDGALAWFHVFMGCDLHLGEPLIDANDELWIGGALQGSCLVDPGDEASSLMSLDRRRALLLRWNALSGEFVSGELDDSLEGTHHSTAAGAGAGYFVGWVDEQATALVKTDAAGVKQWSWSREGVWLGGLTSAPDDGVLVTGHITRSLGAGPEGLFVTRLDPTADTRWSLNLPTRYGSLSDACATPTHFFLLGISYPQMDLDPGEPVLFAPNVPSAFISRYAF